MRPHSCLKALCKQFAKQVRLPADKRGLPGSSLTQTRVDRVQCEQAMKLYDRIALHERELCK
jgi:hypothetical protein